MWFNKRNFLRSGEFSWDRKRDFLRCSIFHGTGEDCLKTHTVQAVPIGLAIPKMAHGGDDDPTLAILDFIGNRFVLTSASLFLARIGGRENGQVFGGAAHVVIELIFSVHPGRGDSFHDRMIRLANADLKGMPGTVPRRAVDTGNKRFISKHFPFYAVSKIRGSPPQADHFIISIPVSKGIVCGMNQDQSASLANELNCRLLGLLSPFPSIIVKHHCLMPAGKWIPVFPFLLLALFIFFFSTLLNSAKILITLLDIIRGICFRSANSLHRFGLGGGIDLNREFARCPESGFDRIGCAYPVVVILSVDNKNRDELFLSQAKFTCKEKC